MSIPAQPPASRRAPVPLRTSARRFETYTRVSLYGLLGLQLLFSVGLVVGAVRDHASLWLLVVLTVAQTVLNAAVCRWSLIAVRPPWRTSGPTRRLLLGWAVVTVATWTATVLLPLDPRAAEVVVRVVGLTPFAAVAPALGRRAIWLAGAACLLVAPALLLPWELGRRGWGYVFGATTGWTIAAVGVALSFWVSGWMLRVVRALDAARGQAASLAIAEERLRISRDLHDVFGRTLTTVAVKSELSAELARRGRTVQAADEMAAVRRIADEAAREVRQVVNGVRHADLTTELAGARSLLDSAGIRCTVAGVPPGGLDPAPAGALAWTLREAVTNVIRHSRAEHCVIELSGTGPVLLRITNDGIPPTASGVPGVPGVSTDDNGGHGLVGIAERLAAVGGRLEHRTGAADFVLRATVPLRADDRPPVPPVGASAGGQQGPGPELGSSPRPEREKERAR